MRQSSSSKRQAIKECAHQQHYSKVLFGVSILGTVLATVLLVVDGWMDALAIYVVCGLMLTVFLSRYAGQQAGQHTEISISADMNVGPDPTLLSRATMSGQARAVVRVAMPRSKHR